MPKPSPAEGLADALFAFTRAVPWWAGLVVIPAAYALLRWVLPGVLTLAFAGDETGIGGGLASSIGAVCVTFAPMMAGLAALIWLAGQLAKLRDGRLLTSQTGIDSIRRLDWRTFEDLLAAAFRRQGYRVETTPRGADGGVDLRLSRDGQRAIVQAKQWRSRDVGVKPVRELRGVGASEGVDQMIFVTSGRYTAEAQRFAKANGMTLIDGHTLARMIAPGSSNQITPTPENSATAPGSSATALRAAVQPTPTCPACRAAMIRRTARKGPSAGRDFWGCSTYPRCRGTRAID